MQSSCAKEPFGWPNADQSAMAFINYQPRNSDPLYPLYFSLGLLMIGFIGEYYTRQRASSSWLAKI